MLSFIADAVSSSSCPILFKVLTLNVTICIVYLHFCNFCLSSVADFSNTEARVPSSAGCARFWLVIWVKGHSNLSMAVFILIYRSHPYRWAVVVPWSNYLILTVGPQESYAQDLVCHCVELSEGLSACFYVHHAASHGFQKKFSIPLSFPFCHY